MPQTSSRSRTRRNLFLWIGYWAVLFVATHRTLGAGASLIPPGGDKLIHFVAYFVLVILGDRYMRSAGGARTPARKITWAGIYAAYGGLDEWLQGFVSREPSLGDWIADVAGIAAATLVLAWQVRSGVLSERGGRSG